MLFFSNIVRDAHNRSYGKKLIYGDGIKECVLMHIHREEKNVLYKYP